MDFLWSLPYGFLILCLGLYFEVRMRRVMADLPCKVGLGSFLWEQCTPGERRSVFKSLLLTIPVDHTALQALLLLAVLQLGGAGCLVWYALFSLLWLRPVGALSALWHYYRGQKGGPFRADLLLEGALRRRGAPPRPRLVWGLGLLQALVLCCALPLLLYPLTGMPLALPVSGWPLWAALGTALLVLCLVLGNTGRYAAALLFLLFLLIGLLANLANLFPALGIILLDSIQIDRVIFALTGAGLAAAIRSGARFGAATAVQLECSPTPSDPSLSHPVCHSFHTQLRFLLQLVLQLIIGLLFVCARLVPHGNNWVQAGLYLFLTCFSLLQVIGILKALWNNRRSTTIIAALLTGAAFFLQIFVGWAAFSRLFEGTCWLFSLAMPALLLLDDIWYFILLEHYRDHYIWHVVPHSPISLSGPDL